MGKLCLEHSLRPAALVDLTVLLTLVREYYDYDQIPFDPVLQQQALLGLLQAPTLGQIWLLEDQGQAAGYAVVTYGYAIESGGREALLDELYLRQAYRGQQLGSRLLAFIEAHCRQVGATTLVLVVEPHNQMAQGLYRRRGYLPSDRVVFTKTLEAAELARSSPA